MFKTNKTYTIKLYINYNIGTQPYMDNNFLSIIKFQFNIPILCFLKVSLLDV